MTLLIVFALVFLAKAGAQQPNSSAEQAWQVHEARATELLLSGQPEAATQEYLAAVTLAPKQLGLHEELGDAIWSSSRMTDAAAAYEAELALDPNCSSSLFKLGSLEVMRSNPEGGATYLRHALEIDPSLIVARYYLGRAEIAMSRLQDAQVDLELVISTAKQDSVLSMAWYQLSILNRKLGKPTESSHALENFRVLREHEALNMSQEPMVPTDRRRELPHKPPSPM